MKYLTFQLLSGHEENYTQDRQKADDQGDEVRGLADNLAKQTEAGMIGRPINVTLREKLITQKADLAQRLADVNEAITALDENPNFESVMNTIGKVGYL